MSNVMDTVNKHLDPKSREVARDAVEETLLRCAEICARKANAYMQLRQYKTHDMTGDELEAAVRGCRECTAAIIAMIDEVCGTKDGAR